MDEEVDFVRAIKVCPGDRALRLIYADWLEERGDSRSQYLRIEEELLALEAPSSRQPASRPRMPSTSIRATGKG